MSSGPQGRSGGTGPLPSDRAPALATSPGTARLPQAGQPRPEGLGPAVLASVPAWPLSTAASIALPREWAPAARLSPTAGGPGCHRLPECLSRWGCVCPARPGRRCAEGTAARVGAPQTRGARVSQAARRLGSDRGANLVPSPQALSSLKGCRPYHPPPPTPGLAQPLPRGLHSPRLRGNRQLLPWEEVQPPGRAGGVWGCGSPCTQKRCGLLGGLTESQNRPPQAHDCFIICCHYYYFNLEKTVMSQMRGVAL